LRVLVTGIAGFAGRHLLRELARDGTHEIHGVDHTPLDGLSDWVDLRAGLASYRPLDVTDAPAVDGWLRSLDAEAIVHLAAQASGADALARPTETYRVNVLGLLHLLEAMRVQSSHALLLLVGSADSYGSGPPGGKIREDAPLRPKNPYALSKAAQDSLAEVYGRTYGLRVIRTRTFTHTGPGQRPRFALAGFADQLARIEGGQSPPELKVGNLDVVREYGDVRDVVRAYALLLGRGAPGEAYNVATGRGYSLRELLDRLRTISGVDAVVKTDPSRLRPQDSDHLVGDPTKLEQTTGWTPRHTVDETLRDLYQDARERVRLGIGG
jgi:GDP-4-dehydro-6-deoxy-D-mannose reductase